MTKVTLASADGKLQVDSREQLELRLPYTFMGDGELRLREQVEGSPTGLDEDLAGTGADRNHVVAPLQIEVESRRRAEIPPARKVVDKKGLGREGVLARPVVVTGEVGLPVRSPPIRPQCCGAIAMPAAPICHLPVPVSSAVAVGMVS